MSDIATMSSTTPVFMDEKCKGSKLVVGINLMAF
jgi:hypothetical protein